MPRYWGFWTRGKLDLLRDYLDAFTTASKSVSEIVYLDLFGGQPVNRERHTDELLDGSARIALDTNNPPFSRLRFFELEPYATRLRGALDDGFPGRDFQVIPGDCNLGIHAALSDLSPYSWAPTFAFVDPNGPDVHWATLEALAGFKKEGRTKVELWMLFSAGMFIRLLPVGGDVRDVDAERLTRMFGTDQWRAIYEARVREYLTPAEAREEYVNLMRWRLENVLGYQWTHPLDIKNERGLSIYHMIFATDHGAGNKIMSSLYNRAANDFPKMREQARQRSAEEAERESGVQRLFELGGDEPAAPVGARERLYAYEPPTLPYGSADA